MNKVKNILVPLALFAFAFIIRIWFIAASPISNDEPFTIFFSQQSLDELFELFQHENNPPFHFLLMHFWMKVFGTSVFSVRFLSVLFGALTVIPIYKIGKEFFSKNVGVITALLFSMSNIHIQEAHDARVYTILVFLSTSSYYFFFKLLKSPQNLRLKFWYTLILVLMLYSHYISALVLFSQFMTVFIVRKERWRIRKTIFVTQLISVVLFIPFITVFIHRIGESAQNESWIPQPTYESLYWILREFFNQPVVAVAAIISLVGALTLLITKKVQIDRGNALTIILWFMVPYFVLFFVSFYSSLFLGKYLLFASVGFYFVVAFFWDNLLKNKIKYLTFLIPIVLMGATCNPDMSQNRHPDQMVNLVKKYKNETTLVFVCPEWEVLSFSYYYNRQYFEDYDNTKRLLNKENVYFIYNDDGVTGIDMNAYQKIIIVDAGCNLYESPMSDKSAWKNNYDMMIQEDIHPYSISVWENKNPI
ncbi:MAG: glycosyltransferase family 39 protein [Candidatus Lokiarchaeia archaeon]|nr:glycosyltransferase family 39 protein [Candidatus Lokiarchaeia archaeon]